MGGGGGVSCNKAFKARIGEGVGHPDGKKIHSCHCTSRPMTSMYIRRSCDTEFCHL